MKNRCQKNHSDLFNETCNEVDNKNSFNNLNKLSKKFQNK